MHQSVYLAAELNPEYLKNAGHWKTVFLFYEFVTLYLQGRLFSAISSETGGQGSRDKMIIFTAGTIHPTSVPGKSSCVFSVMTAVHH